jgi:arylformamidase
VTERRVVFDFEIDFANGGGLSGREFRLDIEGDDIDDRSLADLIVRDLRLLMVGAVRIRNKRVVQEAHRRPAIGHGPERRARAARRLIDLSHVVEHGMTTYKGLPGPVISDHLTREASRAHYAPGTEFHIGRIEMVANTGTYVDAPFHRFADGADLSGLALESLADLEGVVVRVAGMAGRAVTRDMVDAGLADLDPRGMAVLVHTGWAAHWRTERYFEGHPFLTADAADLLAGSAVALVGVDSYNIDDTADPRRPAHTALLRAGIPIVEHLCNLERLPTSGFRFSAVPVKVKGLGTFPVRAYAAVEEGAGA